LFGLDHRPSYKRARFGMDWMNWLARATRTGHWCLTVDPDEFLVYPFSTRGPCRRSATGSTLRRSRAFGAMVIDMYPKGPIDAQACAEGQNPFEIACWFDAATT
jgi:hypothetical protein